MSNVFFQRTRARQITKYLGIAMPEFIAELETRRRAVVETANVITVPDVSEMDPKDIPAVLLAAAVGSDENLDRARNQALPYIDAAAVKATTEWARTDVWEQMQERFNKAAESFTEHYDVDQLPMLTMPDLNDAGLSADELVLLAHSREAHTVLDSVLTLALTHIVPSGSGRPDWIPWVSLAIDTDDYDDARILGQGWMINQQSAFGRFGLARRGVFVRDPLDGRAYTPVGPRFDLRMPKTYAEYAERVRSFSDTFDHNERVSALANG